MHGHIRFTLNYQQEGKKCIFPALLKTNDHKPLHQNTGIYTKHLDQWYLITKYFAISSDAAINMQILSLPNGSLCLCYQHHITSSKSKVRTVFNSRKW